MDGVYLRYFPVHLHYRHWGFDEIASAEARTFSPLREYGGWGIKWGRSGWAYSASGNRGVQLVLRSGKRILIGSQLSERLVSAIRDGVKSGPAHP